MYWCSRIAVGAFSLLVVAGCAETKTESEEHVGEATYIKYCASCHNAGVADAPKLGDAKKWDYRLKKGREALLQSTIDGIPPGMPKKGLCLSCSEQQLEDAIDYMLEAVE